MAIDKEMPDLSNKDKCWTKKSLSFKGTPKIAMILAFKLSIEETELALTPGVELGEGEGDVFFCPKEKLIGMGENN
jgi:hypothetical protein